MQRAQVDNLLMWGAAGALGLTAIVSAHRHRAQRSIPASLPAIRQVNRAAGALAACVLSDSAVEHYRGSFSNKSMLAPLISGLLSMAACSHASADQRPQPHLPRQAIHLLAALTGLLGTGFHLYNVGKRTGRFSWLNLFYAAPLGAPAALSMSGLLGLAAERLRGQRAGTFARIAGLPAGRLLAALSAAGIVGTAAEAGLLHLRGAYHNPAMYLPVSAPPVAAALLARAAASPSAPERLTRWRLRLTALLGFAGTGFHAYGISRSMGGWRNWTQNLLDGPPLPAPPSFAALSLSGLAALTLLRRSPHE